MASKNEPYGSRQEIDVLGKNRTSERLERLLRKHHRKQGHREEGTGESKMEKGKELCRVERRLCMADIQGLCKICLAFSLVVHFLCRPPSHTVLVIVFSEDSLFCCAVSFFFIVRNQCAAFRAI